MTAIHPIMSAPPRFAVTYCSQCGEQFGPGTSGYSHCHDHMEQGTCASCSGSGEGMWDGSTCLACKGTGSQWYPVAGPDEDEDEEEFA